MTEIDKSAAKIAAKIAAKLVSAKSFPDMPAADIKCLRESLCETISTGNAYFVFKLENDLDLLLK